MTGTRGHGQGSDSSDGPIRALDPALQRILDQAVREGGVPGIAVGVNRAADGSGWAFGAAGMADPATGTGRMPEQRFRAGSITKTFVAAVMLQLVSEGILGLDDPVDRWLPGILEALEYDGRAITVRQLLGHTSGLFNYVEDYARLDFAVTWSSERLVRLATEHPSEFRPGTSWKYSNTNYILAGMIIERAGDAPLADQITRRICAPLGLVDSWLPAAGDMEVPGPHAKAFTRVLDPDDMPPRDVTSLDTSMFWAAGGMISTLRDLSTFLAALLAGRLVPAAQFQKMLTTHPTRNWVPGTAYGLGIASFHLPGDVIAWGMVGTMFGSQTVVAGTRDGRYVLVCNINGDWANGPWTDPTGIFFDLHTTGFGRGGD